MERSIPPDESGVLPTDIAARIADRTLASRSAGYSKEVRRLLDAGRAVMRRGGTSRRARVADIVAAAGLSNDAFYRHFHSKDELVAAILDDGTERLKSYLAHQMSKATTPEARVRRWVEGVLAQAADEDSAATTLAVLWNAGTGGQPAPASASALLATLLHEPFAHLGSGHPMLDASLASQAVVGRMADHLWAETSPTAAETEHVTAFVLRAVGTSDHAHPIPGD